MESDFKEDVSALNRLEINLRKEQLRRDKKFVTYKRQYWNRVHGELMGFEKRIVQRSIELKGTCDRCGIKITDNDKNRLKTLPTTNENVCKSCWNAEIKRIKQFKDCELTKIMNKVKI